MELGFLIGSLVKIAFLIAWIFGLMWALGQKRWLYKIAGVVAAYGIIQLALSLQFGDFSIFTSFDSGLLFQASTMAMVAIGLNLIYGFNGQFSLGQWGFYGIGAYTAADITFRWINGDPRGVIVVGVGTILGGLMIWGVGKFISRTRGIPIMSSFTLYLVGSILAGAVAVLVGRVVGPALAPLLGTTAEPGALNSPAFQQIIFFIAVLLGGIFSAEVSFLFGLPVLTLGSDYFGIATLGFTIVVTTLMVNTDTILPFAEMRGGRGMIGIPKMTTWFWAFFFLVLVVILVRNLIHSSMGRAILAVREDETAAKAMGVDVAGTKLLTFVIGSFFAGLGGGIYAHYIGFLSPGTFDFITGFNPLIIVVFGGLGSISGTLAATFGWTFFLEGLLRNILGQLGTEAPTWRYVIYPVTLLLLMLLRPQGLLGKEEWGYLKAKVIALRKKAEKEPDSVPVA